MIIKFFFAKFTRCAKVYGLFLLCFSGADWLGRKTSVTWYLFVFHLPDTSTRWSTVELWTPKLDMTTPVSEHTYISFSIRQALSRDGVDK